jgi:hypothetical protein
LLLQEEQEGEAREFSISLSEFGENWIEKYFDFLSRKRGHIHFHVLLSSSDIAGTPWKCSRKEGVVTGLSVSLVVTGMSVSLVPLQDSPARIFLIP